MDDCGRKHRMALPIFLLRRRPPEKTMESSPKDGKVTINQVSKNVITVAIKGEDHTLGNVVRYLLLKNKQVEFAGYNIPHPSENVLHLRVQTKQDVDSKQVLVETLETLKIICNSLEEKYKEELARFMET
jgi:DNA-directed RNA polymerase I and III subunit RPAC2